MMNVFDWEEVRPKLQGKQLTQETVIRGVIESDKVRSQMHRIEGLIA